MKDLKTFIIFILISAAVLTGAIPSMAACRARPLKIVSFGDSTTAPRAGIRAVYSDRLVTALGAMGVNSVVRNAGRGGDTTDTARRRFATDVLAYSPDVVIIQFGINDAVVDLTTADLAPPVPLERYVANLHAMIDEARQAGAEIVLMSPTPLRWTKPLRKLYERAPYDQRDDQGFNRDLATYARSAMAVAEDRNVPAIDAFALFDNAPFPESLLLDGMHPNDAGQELETYALLQRLFALPTLCLVR